MYFLIIIIISLIVIQINILLIFVIPYDNEPECIKLCAEQYYNYRINETLLTVEEVSCCLDCKTITFI